MFWDIAWHSKLLYTLLSCSMSSMYNILTISQSCSPALCGNTTSSLTCQQEPWLVRQSQVLLRHAIRLISSPNRSRIETPSIAATRKFKREGSIDHPCMTFPKPREIDMNIIVRLNNRSKRYQANSLPKRNLRGLETMCFHLHHTLPENGGKA